MVEGGKVGLAGAGLGLARSRRSAFALWRGWRGVEGGRGGGCGEGGGGRGERYCLSVVVLVSLIEVGGGVLEWVPGGGGGGPDH